MNVDIRMPIGGLFSVIGCILVLFGLWTLGDEALYIQSRGININLWWGLVMLGFGLIMLYFGRRGRKKEASGE